MPKSLSIATPTLNRLRASAGLIPIIEAGLSDGKLIVEKAALMAAFCEWAATIVSDDPEESNLIEIVKQGLERLKVRLAV
jgi:hypothetical protein